MKKANNHSKSMKSVVCAIFFFLAITSLKSFAQYDVQWQVLQGCQEGIPGVIQKINSDLCANAVSRNVFPATQQGWLQVQPNQTDVNKSIGFYKLPATLPPYPCNTAMMAYGVQFLPNGELKRLVSGVATLIGTYDTSDYIRIELNPDSVRFYKNEIKIAASKYVSFNYYIIVVFEQNGGHFDYISSSFDTPVTETVSINQCALISSKTPTVASANGATIRGLKLNGADSIRRSLFRFSLDSIPVRAVVVSAYLKVFCTQATGTYASNLKMINAAWTSAVTWNTKPAVLTTNIVPIDTFYVGKWKNINITNIVQKWVSKTNVNYGLELSLKNEALTTVTGAHALSFASEFGGANKPSVVIQYLADAPFAVLDRKTDGGYHFCDNNRLCFVYNEEYFREEDAKLCYNIYNENMVAVAGVDIAGNPLTGGSPVPSVQAGSNKYVFMLSDMNLPNGNYYLLEVVNSKNEKWYLRFKN